MIDNIDKASVYKKNDSVVVSWSYDDEKGIVLVGHKDPFGIFQRMIPVGSFQDEDGLTLLKMLGINTNFVDK